MATFVSDTMADTNGTALEAHTATTAGGQWVQQIGSAGQVQIQSNEATCMASTTLLHTAGAAPAGTDYDVQADLHFKDYSVRTRSGISARALTSGVNTQYKFWFDIFGGGGSTGGYLLDKIVAGASTNLGTFTQVYVAGNTATIKLSVTNAAKIGYVGGVSRISSADNAITGAGRPGIAFVAGGSGASVGGAFLNYTAVDSGVVTSPLRYNGLLNGISSSGGFFANPLG